MIISLAQRDDDQCRDQKKNKYVDNEIWQFDIMILYVIIFSLHWWTIFFLNHYLFLKSKP